MQVLVFHTQTLSDTQAEQARCLLSSFPVNHLLLKMMTAARSFPSDTDLILVPEAWQAPDLQNHKKTVLFYSSGDWVSRLPVSVGSLNDSEWIVSNAAVLTKLDREWLKVPVKNSSR